MAKNPPRRRHKKVSRRFPIPEGFDEFSYDDWEIINAPDSEVAEDLELDSNPDIEFVDESYSGESHFVPTPTITNVLPQVLRRAPGGMNVVDVVIEAEGQDGLSYELRVTKT